MGEDLDDIYEEVSKIVEEVTGRNIRDTKPEVYVTAIRNALVSLKKKACKCLRKCDIK